MLCAIWYHLYNLKELEKHPSRSVITLCDFPMAGSIFYVYFMVLIIEASTNWLIFGKSNILNQLPFFEGGTWIAIETLQYWI